MAGPQQAESILDSIENIIPILDKGQIESVLAEAQDSGIPVHLANALDLINKENIKMKRDKLLQIGEMSPKAGVIAIEMMGLNQDAERRISQVYLLTLAAKRCGLRSAERRGLSLLDKLLKARNKEIVVEDNERISSGLTEQAKDMIISVAESF